MSQSEQAELSGGEDQEGNAFDSLETAGDALTEMFSPSEKEQPENEDIVEDEDEDEDGEDQDDHEPDEDEDDQDEDDEFDDLDLEDDESDEGKDQTFKVGDEELTVKQLTEGYMRSSDYTKKTEAVAQERKTLEVDRKIYKEASEQTERIYNAMVDYVQTNLIHPMPDQALAQTNPAQYNQELALHYQTMQEANKIFSASDQAKKAINGQSQQISELQWQRQREGAFTQLSEVYPALRDPSKQQRFEKQINEFAMEIGFTEQDIQNQAPDHRVMRVMHLAKIGLKALNDRRGASKKMAEKPIGKGTSRVSKKDYKNTKHRNSMKRLSKTGSLRDAGAVLGEMLLNQS